MLGGLTPVGITFVVVVIVAMIIGLTTAVYYAWIAPCIERQKRKRALRTFHEKRRTMAEQAGQQRAGSPRTLDEAESSICKEDVSVDEKEAGEGLTPPAPVYMFPKRFRFSTSTQDGVWWFV